MQDFEQNRNYEIITERMKERPINRKKLMRRTVITVSMAIIFGVFACFTFLVLEPVFSNILNPKPEQEEIVLPEEIEEILPEDMLITEEKPQPETTIHIQKYELDIMDTYNSTYEELYKVVQNVQKSMVTVTEVNQDVDWFNNAYENKGQYQGIIFANSRTQIFILLDSLEIESAEEITVTFKDGNSAPGIYVQKDMNLGLSVVSVNLDDIDEETMDVIGVAGLGSTRSSGMLASPVIAIGRIFGNTDSVAYGMITSENAILNMSDCNYEILTTDIYGSESATGFVVNTAGYMIGIIHQEQNAEEAKNLISFVGITELRRTLERMSNGREAAYLGIKGMDVTQEANASQGVPLGAYVTEIVMGSPAMKAGIQSGDIITAIDGISIPSFSQYVDVLSDYEPEETINVKINRQGAEEYSEIEIPIILGKRK